MREPRYVVVNIGCIECGVSSAIVLVTANKSKAEAVAESCDASFGWREGGQNRFEVFELPPDEEIELEYKKAPAALSDEGQAGRL